MQTALDHLECSRCGKTCAADELHNLCSCGGPLLARYDLERAAPTFNLRALLERPATLWRYRELLPVHGEPVSLGEGMTPLIRTERLGARLGLAYLWIKDEGVNPTGTFKARGLAVAVSRARSAAGLVRGEYAEGALSDRRQKDDGARAVGAVRRPPAGGGGLSDGWRRRLDWDVEGLR